jgi:hypothetical protein
LIDFIGWLLGLEQLRALRITGVSFAAAWAREHLFWLVLACLVLLGGSVLFYRRWQPAGSGVTRTLLGFTRGLLLVLLLLTLAIPVVQLSTTRVRQPVVFLVFDGTQSMQIRDALPPAERAALDRVLGRSATETGASATETGASAADSGVSPSRLEDLRTLLGRSENNFLRRLQQTREAHVEAFLFEGRTTSRLRKLEPVDPATQTESQQKAATSDRAMATGIANPSDRTAEKSTAAESASAADEDEAKAGDPLSSDRQQDEANGADDAGSKDAELVRPGRSLKNLLGGMAEGRKLFDGVSLAADLRAEGQVTALGSVLTELRQQPGQRELAAVVLFSDFAQNAGVSPLGTDARSPARVLGKPLYTVGFGPREALDVAVELLTDPRMKRAERTTLSVQLRQAGMTGMEAEVRLTARPLDRAVSVDVQPLEIGRRTVTLTNPTETLEFPFTPATAGRFEFAAEVTPLTGETLAENNRATRQLQVVDDYLRLMYAAYEPTWEWRFIKDVFHRDPLVGLPGFRTYLSSSDPRVRQTNVLFLPTLTPRRSDFFANDVIFLGDQPASGLSSRFCDLVREFVGDLGGGLVVISGPRFGPSELANTPLAELLPVVVDRGAKLRDERPFVLRRSPRAALYPFMQLGDDPAEDQRAWDNLGPLPWYQPVTALHEQAVALAEHPTDTCADGRTPQPLIAIRRYGNGEVIYLGFDELWRLRRKYGDRYYRRFWSQLIYRLGMSHALGADKRFVVQIDRQQYRVDDTVKVTIQAYNENYEPLTDKDLPRAGLPAEMVRLLANGTEETEATLVPWVRPGWFEVSLPATQPGSYALRVKDPLTGNVQQRRFDVTDASAEMRTAIRDVQLQESLARETGGRSYDLTQVDQLIDDLPLQPVVQEEVRNQPLWSTPLWFILIVGLMFGEWSVRRWIHLR